VRVREHAAYSTGTSAHIDRDGIHFVRQARSARALRLAGNAVMGFEARRRSVKLLLADAAVIAAGWMRYGHDRLGKGESLM
jgi:hypothetical protein